METKSHDHVFKFFLRKPLLFERKIALNTFYSVMIKMNLQRDIVGKLSNISYDFIQ